MSDRRGDKGNPRKRKGGTSKGNEPNDDTPGPSSSKAKNRRADGHAKRVAAVGIGFAQGEEDGYQQRAPRGLLDLDELPMVKILRNLDVLDLTNFASTSVQMEEYAVTAFRHGHIGITANRNVKDSIQMLRQFGHLATSISVDGEGEELNIMRVLSSVGKANEGNLKSLQLSSFDLDLAKLEFHNQVPMYKLLLQLEEISFTDCKVKNFGHLFGIMAPSLKKIQFVDCTMDAMTEGLFAHTYPKLEKLVVVVNGTPWDTEIVTKLIRGSPKIKELSFAHRKLNENSMRAIEKLSNLTSLEVQSHRLPQSDRFRQLDIKRLKVVGPLTHRRLQLYELPVMKSLTEITFLNSSDENYSSAMAKFNGTNERDKNLDFPNLKKLTLSTTGNLSVLNHIVPHMKELTVFSFRGKMFDEATFEKLLMFSPQLKVIYIIASQLPTLENVRTICDKLKGNNTVVALRSENNDVLRLHQHANGIIFYPSRDNGGQVETLQIRSETVFEQAIEYFERDMLVRIDDEKVFPKNAN